MYVDPNRNRNASNLCWLMPYCRPELPRVIGAQILYLVSAAMALVTPLIAARIVDRVIEQRQLSLLTGLCLALIGVTPGFLITGIPFGFMALIGLLSLSGMLIRNGIVLVEEIEQQKAQQDQHSAIVYAATSRLRPILLTAFTTVLGLAPLLLDVFFQSMAVVIMFGLGFATILTLLVLPVIYACFHRKDKAEQQ